MIAMENSFSGFSGISSVIEIPPIGSRIIFSTLIPICNATREWQSSCTNTEAKRKNSTRIKGMKFWGWNTAKRITTITASHTNVECISREIPNSLPNR